MYSFIKNTLTISINSILKKQIVVTLLFLILLASVVYCTAPTVTHHGLQVFSDGIQIKDPNTAAIDPNGTANASIDPNGKITGKELNLNSGKFTVDPNGNITTLISYLGYGPTSGYMYLRRPSDTLAALWTNGYNNSIGATSSIYFSINSVNIAQISTAGITLQSSAAITYNGNSANSLSMARHTTTNTAGNSLTVSAGGCTSGATDKAGGNLLLKSGISTGTGTSQIDFYTATAGTTGTTDNTPSLKLSLNSNGDLIPGIDNNSYIGKNDDDTPFAYKGVILKDTTNGKYYRIEIINGAITATDLTD